MYIVHVYTGMYMHNVHVHWVALVTTTGASCIHDLLLLPLAALCLELQFPGLLPALMTTHLELVFPAICLRHFQPQLYTCSREVQCL